MRTSIDFILSLKYNRDMTVCIACMADGGKSLVLAADKEVTYSFPLTTEVEGNAEKIVRITDKIFILTAGIGIHCAEIAKAVQEQKSTAKTVRDVANAALIEYVRMREQKMLEMYLMPRGFVSFSDYISKQQQLNPQIVVGLDTMVIADPQGVFSVALIIAGVDDTGAHIFTLTPPGTLNSVDQEGFASIGVGDIHAKNSLIGNSYSSKYPLKEALYFTFEAKKRSEVAPGVGKMTDIITLTGADVHKLSDEEIVELNALLEEVRDNHAKDLLSKLGSYTFPKESEIKISQKSGI